MARNNAPFPSLSRSPSTFTPSHPCILHTRFDALAVVVEVVEQGVVVQVEERARNGRQPREDVTRGGGILAALQPSTELTGRHQNIDVVAAHEVLRK